MYARLHTIIREQGRSLESSYYSGSEPEMSFNHSNYTYTTGWSPETVVRLSAASAENLREVKCCDHPPSLTIIHVNSVTIQTATSTHLCIQSTRTGIIHLCIQPTHTIAVHLCIKSHVEVLYTCAYNLHI